MYSYESTLGEGSSMARKRPRPMSRPVSKSFNRISDFIFPDTVHIRLPELPPRDHHHVENYGLPVFNRRSLDQHDMIIIERLPAAELVQRRNSLHERVPVGLTSRSSFYRDRMRDRRKRHTTDNVVHSLMKSMTEEDDGPGAMNKQNIRYPPSYRTTLDPIVDLHQQQRRSSTSSRGSSSDTDITERHYQHATSPKVLPTVWERFPSTRGTTLFIDEDLLDKNSHSSGKGNASCNDVPLPFQFIYWTKYDLLDPQHEPVFLLVHVHKRHTRIDETFTKTTTTRQYEVTDGMQAVRPYFLIRPQTLLLLPNETGKFKCCFGGDPLPTIVWSHNDSRIPELLAIGGASSARYRTHELHDIHYLDIGPITERDHGQIKCSIANRFGREEVIVELLVVRTSLSELTANGRSSISLYLATPADGMPSITQPLNDTTIKEGYPLELSCGIEGLQVTVSWFHNGKV